MQTHTYATLLLAGATFAFGRAAVAADPPAVEQLQERITEMEAQMGEMRRQLGDDWMSEERAEEIRRLVQDVLADADTRASLLQSGATAGYDKGFFIGSTDGSFKLKIGGQIQARYTYNNQEEGGAIDDTNRSGFGVRRAKLKFSGHVIDPSWKFQVNGAFDNDDEDSIGAFTGQGDFNLEEGNVTKVFDNGWSVKFGQFKGPFMREELTSSSRQLAVERSLVNEEFNQDRSIGVQVGYQGESFRVHGMYSNGIKTANKPWVSYDTEYAFMGRAEFLLDGEWKQFKDFTSPRGSEFGMMVGVGFVHQTAEYGTSAGPEETDLRVTADLGLEGDGWSVFVGGTYQDLDEADANPWGIVAQGAYYIADDLELFARYEVGDSDNGSGDEDLSVLTVGVNKYFSKHALKWTTDFGYGFDSVSRDWSKLGAGWRPDASGEDGQFVIRSQFQLLF